MAANDARKKHIEKNKEYKKRDKKENINIVSFPIRHLGTEKAHILYGKIEDYLRDNNVNMEFQTEVVDIIVKDNKVCGVKTKNLK